MTISSIPQFTYSTENPYYEKLKTYDCCITNEDSELFKGKWTSEVFKNNFLLNLEIGSGSGEFMVSYLTNHPDENFIGMDYRFKRSFQLMKRLDRLKKNQDHQFFRFLRANAERLNFQFCPNEVDQVFYFFPDPWSKRKQLKKRLFRENFLNTLSEIVKSQGKFFIKTDHLGYFQHMLDVVNKQNQWTKIFETSNLYHDYPDHFLAQYQTSFEKMFLQKKLPIHAMILINIKK